MRPEIGQQRKWQTTELLVPRFQARHGISAELENLGVQCFELFVVRTEPGDLIESPSGERERKESDDCRPAAEAAQRQGAAIVRRQRELRRLSAWLKSGHTCISLRKVGKVEVFDRC